MFILIEARTYLVYEGGFTTLSVFLMTFDLVVDTFISCSFDSNSEYNNLFSRKDGGLLFISNMHIDTRPCKGYQIYPVYERYDIAATHFTTSVPTTAPFAILHTERQREYLYVHERSSFVFIFFLVSRCHFSWAVLGQ